MGRLRERFGHVSDAPTLIAPNGIPSSATVNYTSSDEDVCQVDSASGALTLVDHGSCIIT